MQNFRMEKVKIEGAERGEVWGRGVPSPLGRGLGKRLAFAFFCIKITRL